MNRPQATLQELLGNRKIKLTRYNHGQHENRSTKKPFARADTYSRSDRKPESVGERQGNSSICIFHTYRFYNKIREYNDRGVI